MILFCGLSWRRAKIVIPHIREEEGGKMDKEHNPDQSETSNDRWKLWQYTILAEKQMTERKLSAMHRPDISSGVSFDCWVGSLVGVLGSRRC